MLLAVHTVVTRYEFIKIFFRTVKRDAMYQFIFSLQLYGLFSKFDRFVPVNSGYGRYLRLLLRIRHFQRKNETVTTVFEQLAQKHPDKACIIFENKVWTYKMVLITFSLDRLECLFTFVASPFLDR